MSPTSRQDPERAQRQREALRGSMPPSEWDKEREWLPLWLMGPVLALVATVGLIGLIALAFTLGEWVTR